MQRRTFLQSSTALGASLGLGTGSTALAAPAANRKQAFAAAVAHKPWLSGYRSATAMSFAGDAEIRGKLPANLEGTLFRNGPARHEIGDLRYHHWFDGDGMLQAWRLGGQRVRHQARIIETPKYLAERKAGRALYPTFDTVPANPVPVTSADQLNAANISVLAHHGRLFALWEAGSAIAMHPETLATEGLHAFSAETAGAPFSAHPRLEPDGTLWNFGYMSAAGALIFWHIKPNGALAKAGVVPVDPISMPHDFLVTARHLVILMPPLDYQPEAPDTPDDAGFLALHRWHPQRPTRVLLIDKNDFTLKQTLELPAQWVFHYGNAWEDDQGVIRFDAARAPSPEIMTRTFRAIMWGEIDPVAGTRQYRYQIDTRKGTISESPLLEAGISSEFPVIDPRVSGRRYQQIFMLTARQDDPTPHGALNAVSRLNLETGALDTYSYPLSHLPEEHLFVPAPGSSPETQGWVVGTALDYSRDSTELNVFDARHLGDGPVCTARLPYALPLGLHGKWLG